MYEEYQKIAKLRDANKYGHNEDVYSGLWNFWKRYYKILHPVLQGTSPVFAMIAQDSRPDRDPNDRNIAMSYLNAFGDETLNTYATELPKSFKKNFEPNYGAYQMENSFPLFVSKTHPPFRSIDPLLGAIGYDNLTKAMSSGDRKLVWDMVIIPYLKYLRDDPLYKSNPEFQKKQFEIVYKEIMSKFSDKMNGIEKDRFEGFRKNGSYKHLNSLRQVGLEPSYEELFSE